MRAARLLLLICATSSSAACGGEATVLHRCTRSEPQFDVEETSRLEDAQTFVGMHDAIVFQPMASATAAARRLTGVDVLVVIPESIFGGLPDGSRLDVEIFDALPPATPKLVLKQRFEKAALTFEAVDIPNGALSRERAHRRAWWHFPIAGDGLELAGSTYLVGVHWPEEEPSASAYFGTRAGIPIGYSNFNRACDEDWTSWPAAAIADSGVQGVEPDTWYRNDTVAVDAAGCSWPLMRIQTAVEELTAARCE